VESKWSLDSEVLSHVVWDATSKECVSCYRIPDDPDEAGCLRENNPELAAKVMLLLNGELAAACGLPQALLVGRMVDKLGLDRSTVVIVLDELQSLICGETKP
jgi:hypothetical protein